MFKKLPFKAKLSLIALPILIIALILGYYLSLQETSTKSRASSCEPCYEECKEYSSENQRQRCRAACRQHCEPEQKSPTPTPYDCHNAKCGNNLCEPACNEDGNKCPKDCSN